MRCAGAFASVATLLTFLSVVLASPLLPDTSLTSHYKRQVVSANVCATISIRVPIKERTCVNNINGQTATVNIIYPATGYTCRETGATINVTLADSICLCLQAGLLTPDSVATLNTQVLGNTANTARLTGSYNGALPLFDAASLAANVTANVKAQLGSKSTSCVYGTGAYPSSCTDCSFTCAAGQKACGRGCIANSATCISNGLRRRDQMSINERCPGRLTACAIPNSKTFDGLNFECVDTSSNIESCGACAYPLPGQQAGQDCTSIANTLNVACHRSACKVLSCQRGFTVAKDGKSCILESTTKAKKRIARERLAKRQVRTEVLRNRAAGSKKK